MNPRSNGKLVFVKPQPAENLSLRYGHVILVSNIGEVHSKPRLTSLSTYYLDYGHHVAQLCHRRHRRHCRAYTLTSSTASHDNHEKPMGFLLFAIWVWSSAIHDFDRQSSTQLYGQCYEKVNVTFTYYCFET